MELQPQVGSGWLEMRQIREGLNIGTCDYSLHRQIEQQYCEVADTLTFNLLLSGESISVKQKQGRSVGAVWVVLHVCRDIGLDKIIGSSKHGLLGLWMVMARLIEQGSRLSAVRLADEHAVCDLLGVDPFTEDELYQARTGCASSRTP